MTLPNAHTNGFNFKIAVIATAFTPSSHAHVITRRWVDPLPTDAAYEWTGARTRLASLYLMQKGPTDQSRPLIDKYGVRDSPDIADALTLGTGRLAVDAVMIIGEHGDFPHNELGQKLYPRKELFDEVMNVIEASGRRIPLYFDKHFSWNPDFAREMFARVQRGGLPFFGGSCTPHNPMLPAHIPLAGRKIRECVITTWGELEGYLFHALEVLESLVENREGGETGLKQVRAWSGVAAWKALNEGILREDLLDASTRVVSNEIQQAVRKRLRDRVEDVEIFELTYRDGLRAVIVRLNETLRKWAWACEVDGLAAPVAAVPVTGSKEQFYPHFARLSRRIEDFFLTGVAPIPPTRLLFTTLACAGCMKALALEGSPVDQNLPW